MKYENGDKVKCIYNYNDNNLSITVNKIYEVIKDYDKEILILNDIGIENFYLKDRFELYNNKKENVKVKCLFCDNEAEKDFEICKDCRELFEKECVESEYPICHKCRTYESECGCN